MSVAALREPSRAERAGGTRPVTGSDGAPASPEPPGGFTPGSRLGPYEIVGAIGAGGMGTVYRAHDARLRRDVALKVISASFVRADSVQRFEREARAAAALNHPNILAVFDVNIDGPVPYVVSELLEGESLRARIDRGPIPYRKAIEYAIHIAQGLAAAHAKQIYHRDVKPGNVFLMSDGRVKLLDFGLAKLPSPDSADLSQQSTTPDLSHPGRALGTAAYMSPEQVLGQEADQRSDIFALGSVLYEMLTGARAFQRPTSVETMSAVLRDEPPDVLALNPSIAPGAAATVRRCLEKNRDERFQSARDLAFHLQQLAQSTSGSHPLPPLPTRWRRVLLGAILLTAALAATLPWLLVRPTAKPSFQQLTFHRGRIGGARFTDAGVVYSQARELESPTVYLKVRSSPEPTPLYEKADVLAFCSDELALSVGRRFVKGERLAGTLASAPPGGGRPRPWLDDVEDADCDAQGRTFAVVRSKGFGAESTLEYPTGKVLYRTAGSLHSPRISRDGRYVAVIDDPAGIGTSGRVVIVDRDRPCRAAHARMGERPRPRLGSSRRRAVVHRVGDAVEPRAARAPPRRAPAARARGSRLADHPGRGRRRPRPPHARGRENGRSRGTAGRHVGARPLLVRQRRPRRAVRRRPAGSSSATASASTSATPTARRRRSSARWRASPTTSRPTAGPCSRRSLTAERPLPRPDGPGHRPGSPGRRPRVVPGFALLSRRTAPARQRA